jgi:phage shock protein C
MIGGVCGGLSRYLGVDASIVRLVFILLALASGLGALLYLLLWVILPREDQVTQQVSFPTNETEFKSRAGEMRDEFNAAIRKPNPKAGRLVGIALIILGGVYLIEQLHIAGLAWLNSGLLWPALLILAGAALLSRAFRGE